MPVFKRKIRMGFQSQAHSFAETQYQLPPKDSCLNSKAKLDHEHSAQEVQRLLQVRRKLLRDARKKGDEAEVHRLEHLSLWEDILPRAQRLDSKQEKELRMKGVDTMKNLPKIPVKHGECGGEVQTSNKQTKRSLTTHRNARIYIESIDEMDFAMVDAPHLSRGSSKHATSTSTTPDRQITKAEHKIQDDHIHAQSSCDPSSHSSDNSNLLEGLIDPSKSDNPSVAEEHYGDIDLFLEHARSLPPAVPAKSKRRPHAPLLTPDPNFATVSTAALVPAPLFSREAAPMDIMDTIGERAPEPTLTLAQLERDIQAVDDFRAGMYDPGEDEMDIIWARIKEGEGLGMIVV